MENCLILTSMVNVSDHLSALIKRKLNVVDIKYFFNPLMNKIDNQHQLTKKYIELLNLHKITTVIYLPSRLPISRYCDAILAATVGAHKKIRLFEVNILNILNVQSFNFTEISNLKKSRFQSKKYVNSNAIFVKNLLCHSHLGTEENSYGKTPPKTHYLAKKYEVSLMDDIAKLLLSSGPKLNQLSTQNYTKNQLLSEIKFFSQNIAFADDDAGDNKFFTKIEMFLRQQNCSLKPIYELEPSAKWRGSEVGQLRFQMGCELAENIPLEITSLIDMIIPVPETGKYYAKGISSTLDLPYVEAIKRNKTMGRGLQLGDPEKRNAFIRKKLSLKPELVRDKNVGIVDEAIFTGSTLKIIVEHLREAEVNQIYFLIPTPFNVVNCKYNVQPERTILLDYVRRDQLSEYFDVDAVLMSKLSILKKHLVSNKPLCHSCFG